MSQKILVLKGSPRRNGNSSILADQAIQGAKSDGAEVEEIFLHTMKIRPCAACDSCRSGKRECVTQDDMQNIYPKLLWADAIIIASPVYFFTFSAQVKLCIDRWYALEQPGGNKLKGKKFGIILTFGDSNKETSGANNAIHTYQDILGYIGNKIDALVYASASDAGEVTAQQDIMGQAYKMGSQLAADKLIHHG